jgi:hypothetical protein
VQADSSLHGLDIRDTITDFGLDDRIDLSRVDANSKGNDIQHFNWIDTGSFTEKAGQWEIDGNRRMDFAVRRQGIKTFVIVNLILA